MSMIITFRLSTPMAMDEYAWTEEDAVLYMGLATSFGAILSMLSYLAVAPLSRRCSESDMEAFKQSIKSTKSTYNFQF